MYRSEEYDEYEDLYRDDPEDNYVDEYPYDRGNTLYCPSFLFTGHFLSCSDGRPSPSRSKARQQVVIKESPDGDGNLVVERSPSSGDTLWIK